MIPLFIVIADQMGNSNMHALFMGFHENQVHLDSVRCMWLNLRRLLDFKRRCLSASWQGILICIGGLGILVASDQLTANGGFEAVNKVKGDLFMVSGATLYGFSKCIFCRCLTRCVLMFLSPANAAEELLVRQSPLYEVLGQLGMWGTLIIGIQAALLEHKAMREVPWSGPIREFRSTLS